MKECFKCKHIKCLSDFYKHSQMADGYLNKCKSCNKIDASRHRIDNIDRIRSYDRDRGNRQDKGYLKEYRALYPKKYRAHGIVARSIRSKKLFTEPCIVCGETKTVAHHNDYDKPLNIVWMCQAHHKQWHAENGEGKNGA